MLRGCAAAAIIDNRATEHRPPSSIKPNQPVAIIAMQKTRQRGAGGLRKLRVLGGKRSFMTLVHCSIKVYVSSGHTPQCSILGHDARGWTEYPGQRAKYLEAQYSFSYRLIWLKSPSDVS